MTQKNAQAEIANKTLKVAEKMREFDQQKVIPFIKNNQVYYVTYCSEFKFRIVPANQVVMCYQEIDSFIAAENYRTEVFVVNLSDYDNAEIAKFIDQVVANDPVDYYYVPVVQNAASQKTVTFQCVRVTHN